MSRGFLTDREQPGERVAISDIVRSAAEAVMGVWEGESERVAVILADVLDMLDRIRAGDDPDLEVDELQFPHLYHRLLEALRCEMLRQWSDERSVSDESAPELLSALTGLERIRLQLWSQGEEDMVARLAEPGAFDLLVEVAHDLRSPLSSILFLSEALRSGHSGPINEVQKSQLGLIYSAALGMVSISSDVVELAQGGRDYGEEEPSPFSIREVFDSVREMVRPAAEEKEVRLEFQPPRSDRRLGHPVLLTRVLLNLVANALKFTEEGTVTVRARAVQRNVLEFSVEDTGRGMDREQLEGLFRPFKKARHRAGHFFSGSGLGLSIARRMVSGMDAELRVESEPGEGTRFFFSVELPAPPSGS